jgi:hypothetical protein
MVADHSTISFPYYFLLPLAHVCRLPYCSSTFWISPIWLDFHWIVPAHSNQSGFNWILLLLSILIWIMARASATPSTFYSPPCPWDDAGLRIGKLRAGSMIPFTSFYLCTGFAYNCFFKVGTQITGWTQLLDSSTEHMWWRRGALWRVNE